MFLKVYEALICTRLKLWAETEGKLPASQYGFRKGKSTLDLACFYRSIVRKYSGSGNGA